MIPLDDARAEILERVTPLEPEEVPLAEAAGRFLAEVAHARDPIPPFDNSAMDGFAVRQADTQAASPGHPATLRITSVVEAGQDPTTEVQPGEAARIYTGAPIPPGADSIVPFERAAEFDDAQVVLNAVAPAGAHIRRRGDDVNPGDEVLTPGRKLTPAAIGLLATTGHSRVRVGRRPRVALHSSGNELVPIDEELTPGKIRNSNLYSLAARLETWGATVLRRPVLTDTMEAVRQGLMETLSFSPDAIITTGGISAGDLDFIREVAREMGDEVEVRRVALKPGKPLVYGKLDGVPFFGLPGNPAACLISFEVFVRPALAHMEGRPDACPPTRRARLTTDRKLPETPRLQLLRGCVRFDPESGDEVVDLAGGQGSHLMQSFADANCLVRIPPGQTELTKGDRVEIWLLDA